MNEFSEKKVRLKRRSIFLPVIIFPYFEASNTAMIVGWKDRRPWVLKDVKAAFAGKVWLTERHLRAHSALLWSLLSIKIPLDSIEGVELRDQDIGLIRVRYRQGEMSWLLRFILKGAPEGVILLKLGGAAGEWVQALGENFG